MDPIGYHIIIYDAPYFSLPPPSLPFPAPQKNQAIF